MPKLGNEAFYYLYCISSPAAFETLFLGVRKGQLPLIEVLDCIPQRSKKEWKTKEKGQKIAKEKSTFKRITNQKSQQTSQSPKQDELFVDGMSQMHSLDNVIQMDGCRDEKVLHLYTEKTTLLKWKYFWLWHHFWESWNIEPNLWVIQWHGFCYNSIVRGQFSLRW